MVSRGPNRNRTSDYADRTEFQTQEDLRIRQITRIDNPLHDTVFTETDTSLGSMQSV